MFVQRIWNTHLCKSQRTKQQHEALLSDNENSNNTLVVTYYEPQRFVDVVKVWRDVDEHQHFARAYVDSRKRHRNETNDGGNWISNTLYLPTSSTRDASASNFETARVLSNNINNNNNESNQTAYSKIDFVCVVCVFFDYCLCWPERQWRHRDTRGSCWCFVPKNRCFCVYLYVTTLTLLSHFFQTIADRTTTLSSTNTKVSHKRNARLFLSFPVTRFCRHVRYLPDRSDSATKRKKAKKNQRNDWQFSTTIVVICGFRHQQTSRLFVGDSISS